MTYYNFDEIIIICKLTCMTPDTGRRMRDRFSYTRNTAPLFSTTSNASTFKDSYSSRWWILRSIFLCQDSGAHRTICYRYYSHNSTTSTSHPSLSHPFGLDGCSLMDLSIGKKCIILDHGVRWAMGSMYVEYCLIIVAIAQYLAGYIAWFGSRWK